MLGLAASYGVAWAAQAVATWQQVNAWRAALGPLWADEGAALRGNPFEPPVILVRRPALQAEVGGQPVAWRAHEARVQGWWFTGLAVRFTGEAILTPGGQTRLSTHEWRTGAGPGAWRTNEVMIGTGDGALRALGLEVAAKPDSLRITADTLLTRLPPLWASPGNVVVQADLAWPYGHGGAAWPERITAWLAGGAPAMLRSAEATWGGAQLSGAGTLSWRGATPTLEGTGAATGYAEPLARLAAEGTMLPGTAQAIRAVLDLYANAKPPAPLAVTWRDGVLVVGGFPVWRADPAE